MDTEGECKVETATYVYIIKYDTGYTESFLRGFFLAPALLI